eukprot:symbB.v1.2.010651.t1/scaffold701.1/size171414/7
MACEDHLRFFRNFRFVPEVRRLAERWTREGPNKLQRPFLAIHLRPYLFRSEGINGTGIERIFVSEVRHVFQQLRRRWGVVPDTFLASESMKENNTLRILQLLQDLGSNVITTKDTQPASGGPTSAHVAVDALICTMADHFLGTAASSLSTMIASIRFAKGGETSSFIPRAERQDLKELEEYQLGLFPLTSSLPSSNDLQHFFGTLEVQVAASSGRNRFYCNEEAFREGREGIPHDKSGMSWLNPVLPFGGQRSHTLPVTRELCERAWKELAWKCPPAGLLANMQLLIGLQNASFRKGEFSIGFEAVSPNELYLEKARFAFKLWQMLSIGSWTTAMWSAPGLKNGVRHMLKLLAEEPYHA